MKKDFNDFVIWVNLPENQHKINDAFDKTKSDQGYYQATPGLVAAIISNPMIYLELYHEWLNS